MTDHRYKDALRSLDVAAAPLDAVGRQRAELLLERIVAIPQGAQRARRWSGMRHGLTWATTVAALAVVGIIASVLMDRTGGAAYASWTASPTDVGSSELAAVVASCRAQAHNYASSSSTGNDSIPVALAERRGEFVAVLFHRDNPDTSISCVARNHPGSTEVTGVSTAAGGSSGPAWVPPAGHFTEGTISQFGGKEPASFTDGEVGEGVIGVTIHAGGETVIASVKGGRYAAWWPGRAFPDLPPPPSGRGGPEPILTYDIHLADGGVLLNAQPSRP